MRPETGVQRGSLFKMGLRLPRARCHGFRVRGLIPGGFTEGAVDVMTGAQSGCIVNMGKGF